MIPVFQTRVALETFGNCLEACLASILELPLSAIPDRIDCIDADAWADQIQVARRKGKSLGDLEAPGLERWDEELLAWLAERGLGMLELEVGKTMSEEAWLELAARDHGGYWIGVYRQGDDWSHALVGCGANLVHNPTRGISATRGYFGALHTVHLLTAANPARIARRLGPELLPDVAGELRTIKVVNRVEDPIDTIYNMRSTAPR